jgi:hypothetical protein
MSALQESTPTCSRCGCAGPLHREDEVERGCQLAELRTRILKLEALEKAVLDADLRCQVCGYEGCILPIKHALAALERWSEIRPKPLCPECLVAHAVGDKCRSY